MYSIVDASLLRPVNYADPQNLAMLWEVDAHGTRRLASAANFLDWRARNESFSDIAARVFGSYVLTGGEHSEQVQGAAVTANFFRTLGVKPALGRTFAGTEDGLDDSATAPVCVIGYHLWQERLGGDPHVLGRSLILDQTAYTVIGVMPADFWFVSRKAQVWVPISLDRANRDYRYLLVVARRKISVSQSRADLTALGRVLSQEYPLTNKGWSVDIGDLREWVVNRTFRARILLLAGALALILAIACTNAASLLLWIYYRWDRGSWTDELNQGFIPIYPDIVNPLGHDGAALLPVLGISDPLFSDGAGLCEIRTAQLIRRLVQGL